jgi:hypothetical protein
MKHAFVSLLTLFSALSAQADIACPKLILSCQVTAPGKEGVQVISDSANGGFEGYNDDEPSLPPNLCSARVDIPSLRRGISLHASVLGTSRFMAYVYAHKDGGVVGNQAYFEVRPEQVFALVSEGQQLICQLNRPDAD